MKTTIMTLVLAGLALSGCDITFPVAEMDVAGSGRLRPLAMICGTGEAAPGESFGVYLHFYAPELEAPDIDWSIALDYDIGLYGSDETEGNFAEPDMEWVGVPVDAHGFGFHSMAMTVPEDILLTSSTHPDVIEDELILGLARPLLGLDDDEPVTKQAIVELLSTQDPVGNPDLDTQSFLWLADLFSCRIRFRATLTTDVQVDVVKTLTVRYSRRFDTLNVNENPNLHISSIVAIPYPDVRFADRIYYDDEVVTYHLDSAEDVRIPAHDDWTYYVIRSLGLQNYTSPFSLSEEGEGMIGGFRERFSIDWYAYDLEMPDSGHRFFLTEGGDEAEMHDLTTITRISPPIDDVDRPFRIIGVLRDARMEWEMYGFSPGTDVHSQDFIFTPAD